MLIYLHNSPEKRLKFWKLEKDVKCVWLKKASFENSSPEENVETSEPIEKDKFTMHFYKPITSKLTEIFEGIHLFSIQLAGIKTKRAKIK